MYTVCAYISHYNNNDWWYASFFGIVSAALSSTLLTHDQPSCGCYTNLHHRKLLAWNLQSVAIIYLARSITGRPGTVWWRVQFLCQLSTCPFGWASDDARSRLSTEFMSVFYWTIHQINQSINQPINPRWIVTSIGCRLSALVIDSLNLLVYTVQKPWCYVVLQESAHLTQSFLCSGSCRNNHTLLYPLKPQSQWLVPGISGQQEQSRLRMVVPRKERFPDRIHVSGSTAQLLLVAGDETWLTRCEETRREILGG